MKYCIVSGGFDPIHEGHIALIRSAAEKSDGVIALVNSDAWLTRKKGKPFMSFQSRCTICENIKGVTAVFGFDDADGTACDGLRRVRQAYPDAELVFVNGGDRGKSNVPEIPVCAECGISVEFGVGGNYKANSSSWILNKWEGKAK